MSTLGYITAFLAAVALLLAHGEACLKRLAGLIDGLTSVGRSILRLRKVWRQLGWHWPRWLRMRSDWRLPAGAASNVAAAIAMIASSFVLVPQVFQQKFGGMDWGTGISVRNYDNTYNRSSLGDVPSYGGSFDTGRSASNDYSYDVGFDTPKSVPNTSLGYGVTGGGTEYSPVTPIGELGGSDSGGGSGG